MLSEMNGCASVTSSYRMQPSALKLTGGRGGAGGRGGGGVIAVGTGWVICCQRPVASREITTTQRRLRGVWPAVSRHCTDETHQMSLLDEYGRLRQTSGERTNGVPESSEGEKAGMDVNCVLKKKIGAAAGPRWSVAASRQAVRTLTTPASLAHFRSRCFAYSIREHTHR